MLPVGYEPSSYAKKLIYNILSEGLHPPPPPRYSGICYVFFQKLQCFASGPVTYTTALTFLFCM